MRARHRKVLTVLSLAVFLLIFPSFAVGDGAWTKTWEAYVAGLNDPSFPWDFGMIKAGIFSRDGSLKVTLEGAWREKICLTPRKPVAWVTHKLEPGEKLTREAGARLAKDLITLVKEGCFGSVELDIEPMPELPPWLVDFVTAVRKPLDGVFGVSLAIPTVSERTAGSTTWSVRSALKALSVADGLDLMIYDTGAATTEQYATYVRHALGFSVKASRKYLGKSITLGLPAYTDVTLKHRKGIETVDTAKRVFLEEERSVKMLCGASLRVAYYAGWTITSEEKRTAHELSEWRRRLCGR